MCDEILTDYLIVGSGAGMAFADTFLTESDADMVIVDRHAKLGGHWNVAYPRCACTSHQVFWGRLARLSRFEKDVVGFNKGLYDLASGLKSVLISMM